MKIAQQLSDKFAMGLSMLCVIHCLVLPFLLVLLPSLGSLQLADEAFHKWMLAAVIPISIYALTMGCKKHQHYRLLLWGISGIVIMVLAVLIGHDIAGEAGEKVLTLLGAMLIVVAHLGNFRRCQQQNSCKTKCS